MSISDYLSFGLTGARNGDAGTASLTGLYDINRRCWWGEALEILGIDEQMLSSPLLPDGIPLYAGSLDHHMAAIGSGIGVLADVCDSSGTVSTCLALTSDYTPRTGVCYGIHGAQNTLFSLTFDNRGAPFWSS